MTPRMYFTLVLRGIGVWKLIEGLDNFVTAFNIHIGAYDTHLIAPKAYVAHGLLLFAVGALLLKAAPAISVMIVPPMSAGDADRPQSPPANV